MQPLAAGSMLGHYRITRCLGQGGMGVVYEAEDRKLGRAVAIKVLKETTIEDPGAIARFWREARTASALNHPGICVVYELNESSEQPFIVMELLQGQSLDRLYRAQSMPYGKLLEFGSQVADALDAAHRKGVLHRDLKPSNLFLSPSGQAKILDFGLAVVEGGLTGHAASDMETIAGPLPQPAITTAGSAMGTVAYMSPEQARGEPLDARSDVFSLGLVLYELSTGQHPFLGTTDAVTFDRILNMAPTAPSAANPELPPEFDEILHETLEKEPELRCQSAAQLRAGLRRLQRKSSGPIHLSTTTQRSRMRVPPAQRRARRWLLPAGALLLAVAGGVTAWQLWPRAQPFSSIAVEQITNTGTIEKLALSGDGKYLAEVKNEAGQQSLWVRNIATNTDTKILPATAADYMGVAFSPDANYVYFTRDLPDNGRLARIYTMPFIGGSPRQVVFDADSAPSLSPDGSQFVYLRWLPDHKEYYSQIRLADKDGNHDQVLYATPAKAEAPVWSVRGNHIAWIEVTGPATAEIKVMDLPARIIRTIAQPQDVVLDRQDLGHTDLAWLPDGRHLLVLYSKPHADRPQIGILGVPGGDFRPLTNDVNAYSEVALAANGKVLATVLTNVNSTLATYPGSGGDMVSGTPLHVSPTSLTWVSEDRLFLIVRNLGIFELEAKSGEMKPFYTGTLSPGRYITACRDGQILFTAIPANEQATRLFRMNAEGTDLKQLTTDGTARAPYCTPDSKEAYYSVHDSADARMVSLWSVPLAGGDPRKLYESRGFGSFLFARDQKHAELTTVEGPGEFMEITELPSHHLLHRFELNNNFVEGGSPRFSADGKAFAGGAKTKAGSTLFYQPIDGSAPHSLIHATHDTIIDFDWSPSGNKLGVLQLRKSSDVVLITEQKKR